MSCLTYILSPEIYSSASSHISSAFLTVVAHDTKAAVRELVVAILPSKKFTAA
ncbi:uncharacterized protein METZ01_LOCUS341506 [marine metagenome]|uniref:Uncharacterized protein n=1 Tax=marine metagenome TaxID=408172 RepID=A0A382QUX6_9ZZZZ